MLLDHLVRRQTRQGTMRSEAIILFLEQLDFKISFVPQYVLLTSDGYVMDRWNGIQRFDPKRSNAIDKLNGLLEHVSRPSSGPN